LLAKWKIESKEIVVCLYCLQCSNEERLQLSILNPSGVQTDIESCIQKDKL